MTRALFPILILTITACGVGWDDVPGARIRPVVSARHLANPGFDNQSFWTDQVAQAVDAWNEALVERGCPEIFELAPLGTDGELAPDDPGAHEVLLITADEWPHAAGEVGIYSPDGWIHVRDRRPSLSNVPTVLHELGHAAGLEHDEHPDSAMTLRVGTLTAPGERDVDRLAVLLGC